MFGIEIIDLEFETVLTIPQGTELHAGQRTEIYRQMRNATANFPQRFGCYCWKIKDTVYYCGSFSKDYKGNHFNTNLQGRIHNYFTNHRTNRHGELNTNKRVFDSIRSELLRAAVHLSFVKFKSVRVDEEEVDFEHYSQQSVLVRAVEDILICVWKQHGQAQWNRE